MSFRGGGGGDGGGGGGRWDVGAAWEPVRGGTCTGREVYVREGSEGRSSSKCITSLMQVQVPVPVQVGQLQEILYCMYSRVQYLFLPPTTTQCPFLLPITSIPHPPHHLPLRTSGPLSNLPAKVSLKSLHDWKGLKGSEYSRLCAFITTYHTSSNVKDRLFR